MGAFIFYFFPFSMYSERHKFSPICTSFTDSKGAQSGKIRASFAIIKQNRRKNGLL